ncbi:MAG: hypothetical protein MI824_15065 [Hyphomicrobiales bacterium]|nr:hypothetical protein [Hyphomicrobiales bacterium]
MSLHVELGSASCIARVLPALHLDMGSPTQVELDWLQSQGVSRKALVLPWPIGACLARLDAKTKNFDPDDAGERAITILVDDEGEPIDIAAWWPRTGKVASCLGTAFAIGQGAILNPATYFSGGALHVHEGPLDWLRGGRRGIVILRPELAHAYLGRRERLSFDTPKHAERVSSWLQPPRPTAKLFIRQPEATAA